MNRVLHVANVNTIRNLWHNPHLWVAETLYPLSEQSNKEFYSRLRRACCYKQNKKWSAVFNRKLLLLFKNTWMTWSRKKKNPPLHFLFREVNIQDSFILNFGVCRCTQTHSLKKILQELLLTVTCIKPSRYTHGQRAAVHPTFALRSLCLNYIIPQSTTVSQWVPI